MLVFIVASNYRLDGEIPGSGAGAAPAPATFQIASTLQWGATGQLFATAVSLVASHVSVHLHRRHEPGGAAKPGPPVSVAAHIFSAEDGTRWRLSRAGRAVSAAALLLALGCSAAGVVVDSMRYSFSGLGGLVAGPAATAEYSVATLILHAPSCVPNPDDWAIRAAQALMFGTVVVIPVLQLLVVHVLWHVPLRLAAQRRALVAAELLTSWACLDVFAMTLLIMAADITPFARYVLSPSCGDIDGLLEGWDPGVFPGRDASCLGLGLDLLPSGAGPLIAAAVLNNLAGLGALRLAGRALRERVREHSGPGGEGGGGGGGGGGAQALLNTTARSPGARSWRPRRWSAWMIEVVGRGGGGPPEPEPVCGTYNPSPRLYASVEG